MENQWVERIRRLVEQIAFAFEHSVLLEEYRKKRKWDEEMRLAIAIYESFLPQKMPMLPNYQLAAVCQPAISVSGDYYDFIILGNKIAIVVGDIKGKGLGAALLMAHLRSLVRSKAKLHRSAQGVVRLTNEFILEEGNEEMLASLVYGVFDTERHRLTYCNAGHPYPLVYRAATGHFEQLTAGGLLLGVMAGQHYEEGVIALESQDVLVLFTDGITEAEHNGNLFGEAQLKAVIAAHAAESAEDIRDAIMQAVKDYAGESYAYDDRTLLVLKRGDAF